MKIQLVNLLNVYKDKKYKGLGLRKVEGLNQALLSKWLWRFSFERDLVEEDYTWKI